MNGIGSASVVPKDVKYLDAYVYEIQGGGQGAMALAVLSYKGVYR